MWFQICTVCSSHISSPHSGCFPLLIPSLYSSNCNILLTCILFQFNIMCTQSIIIPTHIWCFKLGSIHRGSFSIVHWGNQVHCNPFTSSSFQMPITDVSWYILVKKFVSSTLSCTASGHVSNHWAISTRWEGPLHLMASLMSWECYIQVLYIKAKLEYGQSWTHWLATWSKQCRVVSLNSNTIWTATKISSYVCSCCMALGC